MRNFEILTLNRRKMSVCECALPSTLFEIVDNSEKLTKRIRMKMEFLRKTVQVDNCFVFF